ncbi:S8 family peptidase [Neolewinella persica]|uniref:S8 family peptidase n=1 Tax=Neolewinella persica TaxID=70998 RepID=UPI00036D9A22|nr:S8 family peptidase [Neolewinella persica]
MKNYRPLLPLLLLLLLCTCVRAQGTRAAAETRLDEVYPAYNLSGEGVLVVMIDRGIDYHHPAFLKPDGTTRLAYVFDMINGDDGNPYGVGQVLDAADINADISTAGVPVSNDNHGHGTACTGIIAGNGAGSNGNSDFSGVAPEATIISIKLVQDGFPPAGGSPGEAGFFNPDYILIALQFARDKIAELGLPSVTLMNIGSIGGPTDGTSTVGRALTDFAADHAFVCGVGDDGGANNVARGSINSVGASPVVDIRISKMTEGNMDVDLWYAANDRFEARLILPGGEQLVPGVPNNAARTSETDGIATIWHNGADVDFYGSTGDRREVFTRISSGTGIYTLRLRGITVNNGDFIATMNPAHVGLDNEFLDFGTNDGSINDYSASPGVISPSDYVFAPTFMSVDGNTYGGGQGAPGEIWTGSSKGPTQDGRLGIDFASPGEVLFGPYSPGSFYGRFQTNRVAGGNDLYGIQNAVSAAAPLTTGIIALMLEVDPSLTPAEILSILQTTARSDNFTGNTPNNTFGHGKIDAKAALDEVNRIVGIDDPRAQAFLLDIYPNPVRNLLKISLPDGQPIRELGVYDVVGRKHTVSAVSGAVNVQSLASGSYFLRVRTAGGVVVKRFVKL